MSGKNRSNWSFFWNTSPSTSANKGSQTVTTGLDAVYVCGVMCVDRQSKEVWHNPLASVSLQWVDGREQVQLKGSAAIQLESMRRRNHTWPFCVDVCSCGGQGSHGGGGGGLCPPGQPLNNLQLICWAFSPPLWGSRWWLLTLNVMPYNHTKNTTIWEMLPKSDHIQWLPPWHPVVCVCANKTHTRTTQF